MQSGRHSSSLFVSGIDHAPSIEKNPDNNKTPDAVLCWYVSPYSLQRHKKGQP
jgi:hypothetical protein